LRLAVRPTPLFVTHGKGAALWDVDGNRYIDYTLAYGPLILGHAHASLQAAVRDAAERGSTFGAQHTEEMRLARSICSFVPCADSVCLTSTGTEAVMVAIRLARAFTGRDVVLRFEGHYHGWSDTILATGRTAGWSDAEPVTGGQSRGALADVRVLPWNTIDELEQAFDDHGDEIACVICEPIVCNSGCIMPRAGYLERLRELTAAAGALLVFDEVITGFRVALGGAQERLGTVPDLATFGKALSGGYPLAAVAGRGDVMDMVATGKVMHMGTLNGNTLCTAAASATLDELSADDAAPLRRIERLGSRLAAGIRDAATRLGIGIVVNSVGSVFETIFTGAAAVEDHETYRERSAETASAFAALLLEEGVYVRPSCLWYLSTVHTDADVDATIEACSRALARLAEGTAVPIPRLRAADRSAIP
jgi:glutamate-1-semialdehyde 2,1-aminomutase